MYANDYLIHSYLDNITKYFSDLTKLVGVKYVAGKITEKTYRDFEKNCYFISYPKTEIYYVIYDLLTVGKNNYFNIFIFIVIIFNIIKLTFILNKYCHH